MTQRDTETVTVLFMEPAFVTTPKNDMGGILDESGCVVCELVTQLFWGVCH